uniref:Uncharacterized protein n=1 Tax=Arundo donax TaxID=35708 RepID=A0A0A8Z102_ARUDO
MKLLVLRASVEFLLWKLH